MNLIKAKRNALIEIETENLQKHSGNNNRSDNTHILKTLNHERSGFQISALLSTNTGKTLEEIAVSDDQESNYTSSELSEEIIVTTDDEGSNTSNKAYYFQ